MLQEINQLCVENRIDLLPVCLTDMIAYIGPLVIPKESACVECCINRVNSNQTNYEIFNDIDNCRAQGQLTASIHPSMVNSISELALLEFTTYYTRMVIRAPDLMTQVDFLSSRMEQSKILKVPRCHVCSNINVSAGDAYYKQQSMKTQGAS